MSEPKELLTIHQIDQLLLDLAHRFDEEADLHHVQCRGARPPDPKPVEIAPGLIVGVKSGCETEFNLRMIVTILIGLACLSETTEMLNKLREITTVMVRKEFPDQFDEMMRPMIEAMREYERKRAEQN